MMTLKQAAKCLGAKTVGPMLGEFDSVSTDTRSITEGSMFVALRGPNFDGHDFIAKAREQGAVVALVDHPVVDPLPQIVVDATRLALGRLAAVWRAKFDGKVIGVTGSNGKTTVKEMLASIMSRQGGVLATEGNLNNDIGVPLMLLRLRPGEHKYAVLEMGANHVGEIAYLSSLVQPDVALVTSVGSAHLEGFGSVENIARAKSEIWQGMKETGTAVINLDDDFAEYWRELLADKNITSFGLLPDAEVRIGDGGVQSHVSANGFENQFVIQTAAGSVHVSMALIGRHNLMNALAAAATALAAGASMENVQAGLASMKPVNGRLQPKVASTGQLVIDDSYNANPTSVNAAVDVLADSQGTGCTILVLGDMAELGDDAGVLHFQVGERAKQKNLSFLLATGSCCKEAVRAFGQSDSQKAEWFADHEALISHLQQLLETEACKDAVVLVKGSRSARMERVVNVLCDSQTAQNNMRGAL